MTRPEVRVLAGRWKGRRLEAGSGARPTASRARKALFDILGDRILGARVLELYAGSGAVGIEAVSRGAKAAILVESDALPLRRSVERIGANPAEVAVVAGTVRAAVEDFAANGERFDLIFADPPYEREEPEAFARAAELLKDGGLFVLQADAGPETPALPGLALLARRAYGRNVFYFFGMR